MNNIAPLNVNLKRCIISGQMYDLVSYDEYINQEPIRSNSTAIIEEYKGDNIVLPYRGTLSGQPTLPGIYNAGCVDFCIYPEDNMTSQYIPNKIIDINNKMAMKDILEKEDIMARLDEPWITSPDNITKFPINDADQPEMVCLKTALNEKEIDFDKYSPRFGDNFPNDKRQLKNNGATLNIIKRFCEKCDMEAILILRDKNPNVPNPIGKEISVSLTEDYFGEEDN